ncbi:MAG: P-loop NTPase fold protein, partial [Myxococcota bacterium]|nr:P-loop NTPase fold protein [Myxococcota bacterium]
MSVDELSWPPLTERGHAARTLAAILQHTRTGNGGVDRLSMLAAVWQDPLVGKAFSAQAGPQASLTKRLQELVPGRRPPQKWVEAANPSLGLAAGLQLVQRDIADEPLDPADLARAAVLGDGPEELDAWLEDADVDKERAAEDLAGLAAEVHTPRSGDVGTFRPENAAPEAGGIAQQPDSSLPARDPAQEQAAQPRSDSSWQRAAAATAVRLRQGNGLAHCVLLGRGLALGPAHSFGGEGQHHIRLPSGSEVPASVELRDDALDYALFRFARDANEGAELTAMSTDLGGHWHATFEDPYTEETWTAEGEVQGWNYSQGGIRVRLGPARTESGVSGTPFFSSRGQLLGIITRGANGEAEGVPIALALWDARVRALADLPPLIQQGDPRSWVTSGGAREPTTDTAAIAKQMGIQLIENGLGLRTGGQPGTDEIVTRSMLTESVRKGAPPAIQVVRGDAPVSDFFARFPTQGVPDGATWTGTALEGTDLVVALGGGPAVRRTVEAAAARDILVLAPPRAWNGDSDPHNATHRQWGQFLSGSAMGLHRDLKAADTEKAKGILGRILSLFSNRRGGAPGHAPEAFGLANDAVGTGDLLDLEGTADRFARVMISRHMEPPLAIGLFGPWGSGKSHFMKLLQSGCERLQGKQEYVGHVAPIWFNAWHYMDRNLWASLAGNIFDGIARHLVSTSLPDEAIDRVPTFVDVRAGLTQRLSSTLEARREAERVEKTSRRASSRRSRASASAFLAVFS